MPGLILFNRRCCFSADDLVLPASALLACHLLQLASLLSLLSLLTLPQRHPTASDSTVNSYYISAERNATLLPIVSCEIAALASAGTVGFRLLLLLSCCLLEAACTIASCCCCCRRVSDNEGAATGKRQRSGQRDWAATRLVKARLFLLVLEIVWHLISLPVLILLLLPWPLIQQLPATISALNQCSNRSVSMRLLAAVAAIDWTVALLIVAALICLLRRLGYGCCLWRRRVRAHRPNDNDGCHANHKNADRDNNTFDGSECGGTEKLPSKLPPLPSPPLASKCAPSRPRRRQLCCFPYSPSLSLPFGLTDCALQLMPLFADLDLVASDVAAGLVLLRRQQRLRQQLELSGSKRVLDYMSGRPIYSATRFFNLANAADRSEVELALRCAKLCITARACCHGNIRRSLKLHGIDQEQFRLTHVSRNCFAGFDTITRNIFVVVTSSIVDMPDMDELVTGVAPIPLPGVDGGAEWLGHAGSVGAAIKLNEELTRHRVLETAAAEAAASGDAEESRFVEVTLTGHGVGGGAAVILTLMALARGDTWPRRARVLALAPPGGLLGREAATLARRFATAVVIGRDAVARLGPPQAAVLRRRMMRLLADCRAHRWSVICRHLMASRRSSSCCCNLHKQHRASDAAAAPLDEAAESDAAMSSSGLSPTHPALQLPGRVLHVVRARGTDGKPVFHALRADGTDFDEILASPSMLRDHSLGYAAFALTAVLADYDRLQPSPRGSLGDLRPPPPPPPPPPPSSAATSASIERRLTFRPSRADSPEADFPIANASSAKLDPVSSPSLMSVASDIDSDGLSSSIMDAPVDCNGAVVVSSATEAAAASALLSMMPHSHTMPASVLRNFGLPQSSSSFYSNGQAPIATPESLSMTSVASSSLSDLSSGGYRRRSAAMPSAPGRPLSDLFGYCYYLFPDEEAGRRRPFDDILPRPRVNFGCIAAAMSASTPPPAAAAAAAVQADRHSTSSSCDTITECAVAAPVAASAIAVACRIRTNDDENDADEEDSHSYNSGSSDLESAERTPRLLRSGINVRLLSADSYADEEDAGEGDEDEEEEDSDNDIDSDDEEGRLYMTMDSDASGVSVETVIAGTRGGDYV